MHPVIRTVLLLAIASTATPALARDLFESRIGVDGETVVETTNSIVQLNELFDDESLAALFPDDYIPDVSAVVGAVDLRGLAATLSYAADSSDLHFLVPTAGIDVTFSGATRDQSQEQFEDWLKGQDIPDVSDLAITDLLQAFVAHSPVEPVAGNPDSLESRMFAADLGLGTLGPFLKDFPDPSQRIPSLFKLDAELGYFAAGPYNGQTYDLELGFGWNILRRLALVTDLEMLFNIIEGDALAGHGTFGLGLQGRILDWWNLALVARAGLVGSIDVGALTAMFSVSAVNHMRFDLDGFRVEMKNMVGYSDTAAGFEIEGIELDYDLTNVVLKNGLELSKAFPFGGGSRELRGKLFWTDSHYFVDELWLEHSDEIGLGLGLASKSGVRSYDPINLDVSYVFGNSYDAVKFRFSFRY